VNCPDCGHDLTGDSSEFVSGGGFAVSHSVVDGVFQTEFSCPQCGAILDVDEEDRRSVY
jgi:predicted RNA-binding Zn-ribbon protein involved in translation (DUF1610 family)